MNLYLNDFLQALTRLVTKLEKWVDKQMQKPSNGT